MRKFVGGPARHDGHGPDSLAPVFHGAELAADRLVRESLEVSPFHRLGQFPAEADLPPGVEAEGTAVSQPERLKEESVVAEARMRVERQVACVQRDVVADEESHPPVIQVDDPFEGVAPTQAVVADQEVRAATFGLLEELHARVHPAAHLADAPRVGDLQSIVRGVLKGGDIQLAVQHLHNLVQTCHTNCPLPDSVQQAAEVFKPRRQGRRIQFRCLLVLSVSRRLRAGHCRVARRVPATGGLRTEGGLDVRRPSCGAAGTWCEKSKEFGCVCPAASATVLSRPAAASEQDEKPVVLEQDAPIPFP